MNNSKNKMNSKIILIFHPNSNAQNVWWDIAFQSGWFFWCGWFPFSPQNIYIYIYRERERERERERDLLTLGKKKVLNLLDTH